ncbi:MAG: hypothetical protein ACYCO9_00410 [Streptosporangiaceae bacterium]
MDAAQLLMMAERIASLTGRRPMPAVDMSWRQAAGISQAMLDEWRRSQVVVRVDREFASALLDSDAEVPLVPDWLSRLPFDTFACSLAEPMPLDDGSKVCYYRGFLASGIRSKPVGAVDGSSGRVWTTYGPLTEADGIRFLWLFNHQMDPTPRAQTVTVPLKGFFAGEGMTIAGLAAVQEHVAAENGMSWGQELNVLVPLSIQLTLYMAAQEPDLDWIPAEHRSRHKELGAAAKVGNVGWRVGAALRTWRKANGPASSPAGPGSSGWRLPPHIRRAHWHRVRVATRDQAGNITGNCGGVQGTDWHYEMRWFPPTPVNVSGQTPLSPAVRELEPG